MAARMLRRSTRARIMVILPAGLLLLGSFVPNQPAAREARMNKPFLHQLFGDHMVLQRGTKFPVWGWTKPGQEVTVNFQGQHVKTVSDKKGRWMVHLGPFEAGGPYSLTVMGPESITCNNVLVGDVWLCSGQSNMTMGIGVIKKAKREVAGANFPRMRLFTVPNRIALEPQHTLESAWQVCKPATIARGGWGGFSAVGYFFGRELHRRLKIPIGLIHASWSGTMAEAWTSATALRTLKGYSKPLQELHVAAEHIKRHTGSYNTPWEKWWRMNDPGSASSPGWARPAHNDRAWKTMKIPQRFEAAGLGEFDGVVWFRKNIDVPADWVGHDLRLHLGPIDNRDTTWFNGVVVGQRDKWRSIRKYKIPKRLVKAGRNVIAVRVLDTGGKGGLYGEPAQLKLVRGRDAKAPSIRLAGRWKYRETTVLSKAPPLPKRYRDNPHNVTVLYNGMIAPLLPYAIKGAIWYQGESNIRRATQYRALLPAMIRGWRADFSSGTFPFLIVQLANFRSTRAQPRDSAWAVMRESQLWVSQNLPKAGLAVIIDAGEARDIHPKDKQTVGKRLALTARAIAYGQDIVFSGPLYRSMQIRKRSIQLTFDHVGDDLVAQGGKPLKGFAIAGKDKKFFWAEARISGEKIIVSSPKVEDPIAVRYGWADNPICNLYNSAGLPASPFRTDAPN